MSRNSILFMVGGLTVSMVLCFIPSIAFSFVDPPSPDNVQSGLVSIIVALIGSGVVAALINSKVNTSIQKSKEEFEHKLEEFKHKHEFEFEYDTDLRARRIEAYKGLWKLMLIFRSYGGPNAFTCDELSKLVTNMSKWYYEEGGGIFLTEINQKLYQYMNMQIKKKIEDKDAEIRTRKEACIFSEEELKDLKNIASAFRTSLLQSIGTREEPKYPTTYDELEVKFDKETPLGRGIYCLKDTQVKIQIKLVGIELSSDDDLVKVQIRKIKDNSKIDEGYAKIEDLRYTWKIPQLPKEDKEEEEKIIGGYLAIVMAKIKKTQNQYSAVKMFDIIRDDLLLGKLSREGNKWLS